VGNDVAAIDASDIIDAQVLVQLGLMSATDVRQVLLDMEADPSSLRDLVNRLIDSGALKDDAAETVRHRTALYMHVWSEDSYLRELERRCKIPKTVVADMLIELEQSAYRRRLGAELVRHKKLSDALDTSIRAQSESALGAQKRQVVDYHRGREFTGISAPLIDGSTLDPEDFKISTLFRSKRTIALVDSRRLAALRLDVAEEKTEPAPTPAAIAPEPTAAPKAISDADRAAAARRVERSGRLGTLKTIADYDVVELLGQGGMGAVYLCRAPGDGAFCAVKVLLGAANETDRGRFRREVEITDAVNHPNVITLLDSGETDEGLSYMVVPSLFGKELRHYMRAAEGAGLPPSMVCDVFEQLLEALEACHAQKVVHRDLKPENVFVIAGGTHSIRLLDFGVAKFQHEKLLEGSAFRTQGRAIVGTPAYLSPDAITNDKIDGRTDLYSLGVMLFEMLTGTLPLESPTPEGFIGQHLICPPLTLKQARPETDWPEALEDLLAAMLAKSRKKRPESCAAILKRLREEGLGDQIRGLTADDLATQSVLDLDQEETRGILGLVGRLFS
jgi:hypothetical protein